MNDNTPQWDSPASVAYYSTDSWYNALFPGERLAFAACFTDGNTGRRVLDLGCGSGRTTHYLHALGADVVGVDISSNLIQAARRRAPWIDFRHGSAEALDFVDASFDVVLFSFNGLDSVYPKDRRLAVIREVWRVLRPQGCFIFSHHNLAAFFVGWYKFLRPSKLRFRLTQIINGNAFRPECYLHTQDAEDLRFYYYYAWPQQVIADLKALGFGLRDIYPNSRLLSILQGLLRTNWLTTWAEPWPYYIFDKVKK